MVDLLTKGVNHTIDLHPFGVNFVIIFYLYQGKKCNGVRPDMTSGAEIIGNVNKLIVVGYFFIVLVFYFGK